MTFDREVKVFTTELNYDFHHTGHIQINHMVYPYNPTLVIHIYIEKMPLSAKYTISTDMSVKSEVSEGQTPPFDHHELNRI